MDGFTITPLDAGVVTILIFIVQYLKKHVVKRWVPFLPFLIGWILAIPVVFVVKGSELTVPVLISNVFLDGLKMAVLSMAAYPTIYKPVANFRKVKPGA